MSTHGTFGTVINCMDGRTQLPVIVFLKEYWKITYIDSITEPGPVKILSERTDKVIVDSILRRCSISVEKHGSNSIAIIAHHDCAGNPVKKETQLVQLGKSVEFIRNRYSSVHILPLWVNRNWEVEVLRISGV